MRIPRNVWDEKRGIYQPRISEEMVLREVVTRLWLAKVKVYRINCPVGGKVRPNEAGLPDLMGYVTGGKAVYLEIKRPGGARRAAQIRFIAEAKTAGAIAGFASSWSDVVAIFSGHGINLPT